MQKLALTVPAGISETPTSFASRLAARNFVSARDLLRDFGLSFQKVADGDEHTIRKLARLGGTPSDTVRPGDPDWSGITMKVFIGKVGKVVQDIVINPGIP